VELGKRKKSVSRKKSSGRQKPSKKKSGSKKQPKPKKSPAQLRAEQFDAHSPYAARDQVNAIFQDEVSLDQMGYSKRKELLQSLMIASQRADKDTSLTGASESLKEQLSRVSNVYKAGALALRVLERVRNDDTSVSDNYSFFRLRSADIEDDEIELKMTLVVDPDWSSESSTDDESGIPDEQVYIDHDSLVDDIVSAVAKTANVAKDDIESEYEYDIYHGHMELEIEIPFHGAFGKKRS
jgi:hypothetical protein